MELAHTSRIINHNSVWHGCNVVMSTADIRGDAGLVCSAPASSEGASDIWQVIRWPKYIQQGSGIFSGCQKKSRQLQVKPPLRATRARMCANGFIFPRGQVVGGSSNQQLADEIAEELGLKCGSVTLGRYADGEVMVQLDEHVRGKGRERSVNS